LSPLARIFDQPRDRYQPLLAPLRSRSRPRRAIVVTFLVNGALHEYLAWLHVGFIHGDQFTCIALRGLASALTFC